MYRINPTAYIRVPFNVTAKQLEGLTQLTLRVKYDDSFVAYLNGEEATRDSARSPADLAWDSRATSTHSDSEAMTFMEFDMTPHIERLNVGENMLAMHGLNAGANSSDALWRFELIATAGSGNSPSPNSYAYDGSIGLEGGVEVRARTFDGADWSPATRALFKVNTLTASNNNIVVSELNYRPASATDEEKEAGHESRGDFEFIELMNTSNQIIELTGVKFTEGIRYEFNHSESLKPEERIVITPENYEGQLDNGGERITLIDAQGEIIESFKYDDKEPWYESSDGDGPSLVRIDPKSIFDPNLNTSWRSSANDGGNPGTFDNTQFEGDELIKYAFNDFATQQIEIQNGYIIFNYQKNLLADDIAVIPQKSNDLQNWYNVEAFEIISQIKIDKNTSKISLKIDKGNENDSSSMKYLRLKLNIIN